MSYPILAKLPQHLNQIKEFKKNGSKLLLSALIWTEESLICNSYKDEKDRINYYIKFIESGNDHDGDCVQQSGPCVLCHALGSIKMTEETIEESRKVLNVMTDDERIIQLIEVVLATQPKKRFNSDEERRELMKSLADIEWDQKYKEYYEYEDDIVKRIQIWKEKEEKEEKELTEELIKYTEGCLCN